MLLLYQQFKILDFPFFLSFSHDDLINVMCESPS